MIERKAKVVRVAAVPQSLKNLLKGQLRFLNQHFQVIGVASPGETLHEVVESEGIEVAPVRIERKIAPLRDIKSLIDLYLLFRRLKPLVVHSITPKAGLLSMAAAYFAGVPFRLHTFTGLVFPYRKGFTRLLLLNMDRILCRFATHIYPEGLGVKGDLEKAKVTSKSLKILANGNVNGIDVDWFNSDRCSSRETQLLKTELRINSGDFTFIFIGRLVREKGVNELVSAFIALHKRFSHAKLLILGRDESHLDPLTDETMRSIKIHEAINYLGYQNDVRPFLAVSDIFVFPSYREGFPNVVLQAGAMGLPSIVTDISGSNEIIRNMKNGIIVQSKDVKGLYHAMTSTITDKSLFTSLKENARKMITERYEQKRVWLAILKEYKHMEKTYDVK